MVSWRRLAGLVGLAAAVTATVLPLLVTPAAQAGVVDGDSFERSLAQWAAVGGHTRLDRVRQGRGADSEAARLRGPRDRAATVGLTDAPSLVRSTAGRTRYVATAWVRLTRAAVRRGPVQVRLSLQERAGSRVKASAWDGGRRGDTSWHQLSVPLTSRGTGHSLNLTLRAFDLPARGAVLVDDVTIARVALPGAPDPALAGTRFGASVDEGHRDWTRALHLSDRRYSRLEVVRFYQPWIRDAWDGQLGDVRRPVNVSFVEPPGEILAGDHDRELRAWFRHAPRSYPVWWTYWHEPEDDVEAGRLSADRYRRAWRHVNAIAREYGGVNLHPTLVLMAWTAQPGSGRQIADYYPGSFIDVMAWDGYNPPGARGYVRPRTLFGRPVAAARRHGARFAVAEFGSVLVPGDDGSRRAQWVVDIARYCAAHNAEYVSYWNARIPGEDYQLTDLPSRLAWRSVVND